VRAMVGPKTLRILNRRILAGQCLSQQASGPHAVVKVSEACCGVNSQDYLESFSSFWARIGGFRDSDLTSEFGPNGGLVRIRTVRGTMHTIPSKDYWIHLFGSPGYRRFLSNHDRAAKKRGIGDREFRVQSLYEPLLDHIKGRAATANEITEFVVGRLKQHGIRSTMKLQRGWSSQATVGPSWTGIGEMSNLGLIVSAGRKGSETLWASTEDWLDTKSRPSNPEECYIDLIRKYIENYGPVTRDDIVYWTFLLTKDVDKAIESLKDDLTTENFGTKQEYLSIQDPERMDEPPDTIILPEFDSLMMGHKDKSRYLDKRHVKKVFWGLGGIHRTILLDGFAGAIWKRKKTSKEMIVHVYPLRQLTGSEKGSIEEEFGHYSDYQSTKISVHFKK